MKQLEAMAGTFIRAVISTITGLIIGHGTIYGLNWKELIGAGAIAGIMVLYNYFNASDPRYGMTDEKP